MPDAPSLLPCLSPRAMRPAPIGGRSVRAIGTISAALASLLLATGAHAEPAAAKKDDTSCAQYGTGFQKMPGGTSCVRTGATVRAEGFSGGAFTSAPNQFGGTPSGSGTTTASDPWKSAR